MLKPYGYFDGKIMKVKDARIAPNDIGILRGFGVFDFFRTFNGRSFLLKEHIDRLKTSAKKLGIHVHITEKEMSRIVARLLAINKIKNGFFRVVVTGGPSESGIDSTGSNLYILAYDARRSADILYKKGATLMFHEHLRAYPEAKTNNYITAVSLQAKKNKMGAVEILYGHNGKILECSTSNIFIVQKGRIVTPKDSILLGITRNALIRMARRNYEVEERKISEKELYAADECFITSTTKDVLPIVKIDRRIIGNGTTKGRVGPVTKDLMELFAKYTEKETR